MLRSVGPVWDGNEVWRLAHESALLSGLLKAVSEPPAIRRWPRR
jgi:hypothetical protein